MIKLEKEKKENKVKAMMDLTERINTAILSYEDDLITGEELYNMILAFTDSLEMEVMEFKGLAFSEDRLEDKKDSDYYGQVICGKCGKGVPFNYKLDPPSPISDWDKETGNKRYWVSICCGKIRMINDSEQPVEYDIPKGVALIPLK